MRNDNQIENQRNTQPPSIRGGTGKVPFNLAIAFTRIRKAIKPFPKAAMFQLRDEGYSSPFEQLVACILSIRTFDEVSLVVARRLFAAARTTRALGSLTVEEIDKIIHPVTFHFGKAGQIRELARRVDKEFQGRLPCDEKIFLSFKGVGAKCANLTLGIACGVAKISVDTHVHRVTNRWGLVSTKNPFRTLAALEKILPARRRIEINELLVPFGKHVCTAHLPRCSTCAVLSMCRQVGVNAHK